MNETMMIIVGLEVLLVHLALVVLVRTAVLRIDYRMKKESILKEFADEIDRVVDLKCIEVELSELEPL